MTGTRLRYKELSCLLFINGIILSSALLSPKALLASRTCHDTSLSITKVASSRSSSFDSIDYESLLTTLEDVTTSISPEYRLPIHDILPFVQHSQKLNALLEAAPGAGKTTIVPLGILQRQLQSTKDFKDQPSQIWVVEPRRIAARSAATRMAALLKEHVGATVGYQMRGESKQGPNTFINVVTDGILLQRLRADPELNGIGCVIFDEFHERGVDSDVALALTRQTQQIWREDNDCNMLKIVVMSATLLGELEEARHDDKHIKEVNKMSKPIGNKLISTLGGIDQCDVFQSDGRQYPIQIFHANEIKWTTAKPLPLHILRKDRKSQVDVICDVISQALLMAPGNGDILVFLPGAAEIRRAIQQLSLPEDVEVVPLYGTLPKKEQDYALFPKTNRRRVIVSSPIAEASLTLERVTCVVDSGLQRQPRCDADTNMPRLVTMACSQASATQRAGRAGRTQKGICLRIYTESDFLNMAEQADPEILSTDLSSSALLLIDWGCTSEDEIMHDIPFIDPPPAPNLHSATNLLMNLGAVSKRKNLLSITSTGQRISATPTHPRLGCIIQMAKESMDVDQMALAAAVSFLMEDDIGSRYNSMDPNLENRVYELMNNNSSFNVKKALLQWASRLGKDVKDATDQALKGQMIFADVAPVLLPGFIDLIGEKKGGASYGGSIYLLSLGRSARLDEHKSSSSSTNTPNYMIVVNTSTGDDGKARIRGFAPVSKEALLKIATESDVVFTVPSRGHEVRAKRSLSIGSIELESKPLKTPSQEQTTHALKETIAHLGGYFPAFFDTLSPDKRQKIEDLLKRVRLASNQPNAEISSWPSVFLQPNDGSKKHQEQALEALVEPWLGPARSLKQLDLFEILLSALSIEQQNYLKKYFPQSIEAPDGSHIPISYLSYPPSASGKLQQFFGTTESPCVGHKDMPIPLSLALLSPGGKVVAQTVDLPFFWQETYPQVRAELRGRYAKHPWPENPMTAVATKFSKKQLDQVKMKQDALPPNNIQKPQKKKRKRK